MRKKLFQMGGVILPPPGDYTGSTKGGVSQHHNYLLLPKGSSLLPSIFLLIVFFLFLYVFSYRFFIHISYCRYVISSRPKMSISHLLLYSGCRSNNINVLFPFRYDINSETHSFGGIAMYICTWSIHTFPSVSVTYFISHNFLIVSTKSLFVSPYIIFLLNFGIKTMWYVQFQRVCVILWLSIWIPPVFWYGLRNQYHYNTQGFIF